MHEILFRWKREDNGAEVSGYYLKLNAEDPLHIIVDMDGQYHKVDSDTVVTDNNVGCKWIPVTERLPEDQHKVLCFKKSNYGSYAMTANFAKCLEEFCDIDFQGKKHGGFFNYDREYGFYELSDITHWMPLPEPPKEG
jgi:hypothetical protein